MNDLVVRCGVCGFAPRRNSGKVLMFKGPSYKTHHTIRHVDVAWEVNLLPLNVINLSHYDTVFFFVMEIHLYLSCYLSFRKSNLIQSNQISSDKFFLLWLCSTIDSTASRLICYVKHLVPGSGTNDSRTRYCKHIGHLWSRSHF